LIEKSCSLLVIRIIAANLHEKAGITFGRDKRIYKKKVNFLLDLIDKQHKIESSQGGILIKRDKVY